MREAVRVAFAEIAARFSDDAPCSDALYPPLKERYSALDAWPADSQLALLVLGFVLGPGFAIRGFKDVVNVLVPDFNEASRVIGVGDSPSLITLGGIAKMGFRNAALVVRWDLDPSVLYWPLDLASCAGATW